jgi:hypothetical protein
MMPAGRSLVPMSLAYVIWSPSDRRSALLLHQQTCVGQVTGTTEGEMAGWLRGAFWAGRHASLGIARKVHLIWGSAGKLCGKCGRACAGQAD